jgi:hypothetical protein
MKLVLFSENQFNSQMNQRVQISCQFLPPDGSKVPGYVLKLLFSKTLHDLFITLQPVKLKKK